jgi:aconitate hydratase
MINNFYQPLSKSLQKIKKTLDTPLTLTEKILYLHSTDPVIAPYKRGEEYVMFSPDRVAMQDATAQMALLQFMCAKRKNTAVPSSVHCDHLIQAKVGAQEDLKNSCEESSEVYSFLQKTSNKYGIDFWKPGAGIIHQVLLENYAFPGGMMIGTDSHTPNAGGLGMLAIGVGGADAVDVMAGMPWELKFPHIIGIHLKGKLKGWASAKDIILKLAGILTVKGGTGSIIEYFGEGVNSISCTGKATICNMGAEIGATTSVFPLDQRMVDYLKATERKEVGEYVSNLQECLQADPEVIKNPEHYYDQVIEIDLNQLEPYINGPFSPDRAWKISEFAKAVKENDFPEQLSVGLIGSCTNSSYEDIERATSIAEQAQEHGMKAKSHLTITPGSEQVRATIERDGHLKKLQNIGGLVLANACGPCIGQWKRHDKKEGEKNSIITSFNRNFSRRNDGNPATHSFVASPEIVVAMTLAGNLTFNPLTDNLEASDGKTFKLTPPKGKELPEKGFSSGENGYIPPSTQNKTEEIIISPSSERLQSLTPFDPWNKKDLLEMPVLLKAKGKCTTDHISPAGPWLRFRGHLDNISNNMFIGAVNAFREETGKGKNKFTNEIQSYSDLARDYKKRNLSWVAIGDENYGEGSSREHAAMEPRYLGARAVIVKSFARIHETNLKKQGILALTFANSQDYNKIQEDDTISILNLNQFSPKTPLTIQIKHSNEKTETIQVNHTFNKGQIAWFESGSALNLIAKQN